LCCITASGPAERVTQITLLKAQADKAFTDAKCDTDTQNEKGLWGKNGCDALDASKNEAAAALAKATDETKVGDGSADIMSRFALVAAAVGGAVSF